MGREYFFYTDFRAWMMFECLMFDGDYPEYLKQEAAYKLIMPEIPPYAYTASGRREINNAISLFYHGGAEIDSSGSDEGSEALPESRRVYAFDHDFPYIYAAFLELYKIDLMDIEYLHWWKFRAMFRALHDCKFTEIAGYRAMEITTDMSDARREQIEELQELYALPVSFTERRKIEQARKMLN